MIRLEKVNKYYNKGKKNQIHVINNISLQLENTGLIALLGPSGCGKTTLLNVIGGLDKIKNGKIYINNERISKKRPYIVDKIRNLNIGYIFQDYKLIDNLSVFDNVALVLKMIGIKDKKEIKKRVNYILETLNIYRFRYRPASMLSGGERQRVAIARALVKDSNIILADEPTGNLDSKNTIEIMNIIKSISKDRLVILVTHEISLAKFYADRIIELEDGAVIKDYQNTDQDSLDYRIENNIYLKDLKYNEKIKGINIYQNTKEPMNITLAVINGNIYIQSNQNNKIEVVDNNSNIKLINDTYKKMNKDQLDKYHFNLNEISNTNYKKKYSSVYNIFNFISYGLRKIMNYSFIKKVLLLGYLASSMFILFSISRIFAVNKIYDKDFVKYNNTYVTVDKKNIDIDDYNKIKTLPDINYVLLGNSKVRLDITYNTLLQNYESYQANISGSLSSIDLISQNDIIYGTMPTNKYEIVVDKQILTKLFDANGYAISAGLGDLKDTVGIKVVSHNLNDLKIVGIVYLESPSIYTSDDIMLDVIYYNTDYNEQEYFSITNFDYTIAKGKNPENDYEVLVPYDYRYQYYIGQKIDQKINNQKLKVVGYYKTNSDTTPMLVSDNTLITYMITSKKDINKIMVSTNDKMKTIQDLNDLEFNANDSYEYAKNEYLKSKQESIKSSLIFSGVILAISIIEIFFMIRSSFLSRIKEVGIYRAIGLKKKDIYTMFLGEILAITLTASMLGIALMTYILYNISKMKLVNTLVIINSEVIIISIIIVFAFNIIFGLIPVFITMRKTPSEILSRNDI